MNPIRPNSQLPVPTARPVRSDVRAAQRAFFEAAVKQAAAAPAEPVRPAAPAARVVLDTPEAPNRYLRPGSLVDIKV